MSINGQGWFILPLSYICWIIVLAITQMGYPFLCLQCKILFTPFYLWFCKKLCRQEGWKNCCEEAEPCIWDHLLQMIVLNDKFKQM